MIQERAWFRAFLTLILEKMVFTSKYNMEMTKREKIIEKYEKKIWGDFYQHDILQERAWFRALLTSMFKKDGFY